MSKSRESIDKQQKAMEGLPVSMDIVNDKSFISVICPDEDGEMGITIKDRYMVHYTLTLKEAKSIADFINNHIQNYNDSN